MVRAYGPGPYLTYRTVRSGPFRPGTYTYVKEFLTYGPVHSYGMGPGPLGPSGPYLRYGPYLTTGMVRAYGPGPYLTCRLIQVPYGKVPGLWPGPYLRYVMAHGPLPLGTGPNGPLPAGRALPLPTGPSGPNVP